MKRLQQSNIRKRPPYLNPFDPRAYTFKNPTKNRIYVKVLRFVDGHPKCSRRDIQFGVWRNHKRSNSTLFSQMLYAGLIGYNKDFEYRITRKGKGILKKVADGSKKTVKKGSK